MTNPLRENSPNRRKVLKGLGIGTLTLPLTTGMTTASRASCGLRASVEPGKGNEDNWIHRDQIVDDFKARIDISGLSGGGSQVATMVLPVGTDGRMNGDLLYSGVTEVDWSSGYIVEGSSWDPRGIGMGIGKWPAGTYYLYAAVAEAGTESFGVAVSDSFTIDV